MSLRIAFKYLKSSIAVVIAAMAFAAASDAGSVVVVRPAPRVWYGPPRPVVYYAAPRPVVYYTPPIVRPVYVSQPGGVWYYCETAKGYYPYVRQCSSPWQAVAAAPEH